MQLYCLAISSVRRYEELRNVFFFRGIVNLFDRQSCTNVFFGTRMLIISLFLRSSVAMYIETFRTCSERFLWFINTNVYLRTRMSVCTQNVSFMILCISKRSVHILNVSMGYQHERLLKNPQAGVYSEMFPA